MYAKRIPLNKLKEERLKHHLTQKDVAYLLGCTIQFYSQIERGKNTLTYDYAVRLALMYETTPDELFFNSFKKIYIK